MKYLITPKQKSTSFRNSANTWTDVAQWVCHLRGILSVMVCGLSFECIMQIMNSSTNHVQPDDIAGKYKNSKHCIASIHAIKFFCFHTKIFECHQTKEHIQEFSWRCAHKHSGHMLYANDPMIYQLLYKRDWTLKQGDWNSSSKECRHFTVQTLLAFWFGSAFFLWIMHHVIGPYDRTNNITDHKVIDNSSHDWWLDCYLCWRKLLTQWSSGRIFTAIRPLLPGDRPGAHQPRKLKWRMKLREMREHEAAWRIYERYVMSMAR